MKQRPKLEAGFTLIELMVVIVIIGILLAIGLPNMIGAQDRAKDASVKQNMHLVQVISETYAIDWAGVYATHATQLEAEGKNREYWQLAHNPYTLNTVFYEDMTASTTSLLPGNVGYFSPERTRYQLYGGNKVGLFLTHKDRVFTLTNAR